MNLNSFEFVFLKIYCQMNLITWQKFFWCCFSVMISTNSSTFSHIDLFSVICMKKSIHYIWFCSEYQIEWYKIILKLDLYCNYVTFSPSYFVYVFAPCSSLPISDFHLSAYFLCHFFIWDLVKIIQILFFVKNNRRRWYNWRKLMNFFEHISKRNISKPIRVFMI